MTAFLYSRRPRSFGLDLMAVSLRITHHIAQSILPHRFVSQCIINTVLSGAINEMVILSYSPLQCRMYKSYNILSSSHPLKQLTMAIMHSLLNQLHARVTVVSRFMHRTPPSIILLILVFGIAFCMARKKSRRTSLRDPPSTSLLYGVARDLLESQDVGLMHEAWMEEYGGAYDVTAALGQKRVFLSDPRAIAHFYSKDSKIYAHPTATRNFLHRNVSRVPTCFSLYHNIWSR